MGAGHLGFGFSRSISENLAINLSYSLIKLDATSNSSYYSLSLNSYNSSSYYFNFGDTYNTKYSGSTISAILNFIISESGIFQFGIYRQELTIDKSESKSKYPYLSYINYTPTLENIARQEYYKNLKYPPDIFQGIYIGYQHKLF